MNVSFLLRFQEGVQPSHGSEVSVKTKTAAPREQPDEGQVVPFAGTKTITEVKREQADADPVNRSLYAVPR